MCPGIRNEMMITIYEVVSGDRDVIDWVFRNPIYQEIVTDLF